MRHTWPDVETLPVLSVVLNADHTFLTHSVFIIFQILECLLRHSRGMGPSRNQEIRLFPMHHTLMTRMYFFALLLMISSMKPSFVVRTLLQKCSKTQISWCSDQECSTTTVLFGNVTSAEYFFVAGLFSAPPNFDFNYPGHLIFREEEVTLGDLSYPQSPRLAFSS